MKAVIAVFMLVLCLSYGCNYTKPTVKQFAQIPADSIIVDTIFLDFRFGMTMTDVESHIVALKRLGKIVSIPKVVKRMGRNESEQYVEFVFKLDDRSETKIAFSRSSFSYYQGKLYRLSLDILGNEDFVRSVISERYKSIIEKMSTQYVSPIGDHWIDRYTQLQALDSNGSNKFLKESKIDIGKNLRISMYNGFLAEDFVLSYVDYRIDQRVEDENQKQVKDQKSIQSKDF